MEPTKTYLVIWRGDEDEFFVTSLDLTKTQADSMSNLDFVIKSHEKEYKDSDIVDCGEYINPYVGDNPDSYDLIEIISGDNITFHMK
jgi:hypothetical protein